MPQMSPLWWTSLMVFFILVLLISNSINYFVYLPKINFKSNNTLKTIKNSWKW